MFEVSLNFIHISPHFPPNYTHFAEQLHTLGVNVFGIADEPYDQLSHELKESLTEYYFVNDMHNYDEVLRACGYFTHKYGKLDAVESLMSTGLRPMPACGQTSISPVPSKIKLCKLNGNP